EGDHSHQQRHADHNGSGRKNSAYTTQPKLFQRQSGSIVTGQDQTCDQKAGNDEENIDPDEAAGKEESAMPEHNQTNCDGPETVNVGSIARRLDRVRLRQTAGAGSGVPPWSGAE